MAAAVEMTQRSGTTPSSDQQQGSLLAAGGSADQRARPASKAGSAASQNLQFEESVPLSDWQIVPSGKPVGSAAPGGCREQRLTFQAAALMVLVAPCCRDPDCQAARRFRLGAGHRRLWKGGGWLPTVSLQSVLVEGCHGHQSPCHTSLQAGHPVCFCCVCPPPLPCRSTRRCVTAPSPWRSKC